MFINPFVIAILVTVALVGGVCGIVALILARRTAQTLDGHRNADQWMYNHLHRRLEALEPQEETPPSVTIAAGAVTPPKLAYTGPWYSTTVKTVTTPPAEPQPEPIRADSFRSLTTAQVRKIQTAHRNGAPVWELANEYGVSWNTIYRALKAVFK